MGLPLWLQWVLALCTIVTTIAYFADKLPHIRTYLQRPAPEDAGRSTQQYLVGALLALICAAVWAASYASLDLVNDSASTLQINVYLMGYGALFLYIGSLAVRSDRTTDLTAPWRSGRAQLLVTANLGNFLLSVLALSFITASEAMTLNNLSPLILAGALWYRGKLDPSLGILLALALVSIGVLLVNMDAGFILRDRRTVAGSLIAVGAGASWAVWTYTMDALKDRMGSIAERMRTLSLVFVSSYTILVTLDYLSGSASQLSTRDHLILFLNGLRVAAVYLLYQVAIEKAGPLLASVVLVLMVPFTFPFDSVWNAASASPQLMIGAALIVLAAVGLLSDELRRAQPAG